MLKAKPGRESRAHPGLYHQDAPVGQRSKVVLYQHMSVMHRPNQLVEERHKPSAESGTNKSTSLDQKRRSRPV